MKNRTSMQIDKEVLAELKKMKKHKRETYEDTLVRLMNKKKIKRVIEDAKREIK